MKLHEDFVRSLKMWGTAIGVMAVVVSAALYVNRATTLTLMRLESMGGDIERLARDSMTISQASEAALRMAIENPGMRVPDPRDPSRIIEVRYSPRGPSPSGPATNP